MRRDLSSHSHVFLLSHLHFCLLSHSYFLVKKWSCSPYPYRNLTYVSLFAFLSGECHLIVSCLLFSLSPLPILVCFGQRPSRGRWPIEPSHMGIDSVIFRWVHPSLYEGVSVRLSVCLSVGRSVCRSVGLSVSRSVSNLRIFAHLPRITWNDLEMLQNAQECHARPLCARMHAHWLQMCT